MEMHRMKEFLVHERVQTRRIHTHIRQSAVMCADGVRASMLRECNTLTHVNRCHHKDTKKTNYKKINEINSSNDKCVFYKPYK